MEELQEADVLWPDVAQAHRRDCNRHRPEEARHDDWCRHRADQKRERHAAARPAVAPHLQSPPVRIPAMPAAEASRPPRGYYDDEYYGGDGTVVVGRASSAEGAGIVPPHVVVARRCADERGVAASVCVGHGRTLKGRDLRAVRNAVLHMTGFLGSDEY